jgi:hypothetical protein
MLIKRLILQEDTFILSLAGLSPGMYFLQLKGPDDFEVHKIIKLPNGQE